MLAMSAARSTHCTVKIGYPKHTINHAPHPYVPTHFCGMYPQAYVLLRPTADGRLEPVQIAGPPCSKIDVTAWSPDFSDGWSAPEENAVFRAPKFCT